jgi:branched-chain amino acid transport system ATP-binding protein
MLLLEASRIEKVFRGFRALGPLDLQVRRGDIHGLIGPNGAGKSTLINVLSGHLAPSGGRVVFEGSTLSGLPAHEVARRGIARSFQITSIFTGYTVLQNLQVALLAQSGRYRNVFRPAAPLLREEAAELLASVGLDDRRHAVAGELAAGDRKRLEFAIALAARPALLLLDEPTAGMSPHERDRITEIIRRLNREQGVTVLLTEHDIAMVFGLAHRITVLHQGEKLAEGSPQAVRADRRVQDVYLGEEGADAALL